jgi:hypothetical protein
MNLTDYYITIATFFASTLTLIVYYRESGVKLEVRANTIIGEKKKIVSASYLSLLEKIL